MKDFNKTVGKPSILHTDNRGEFTANITKLFCTTQKIKFVNRAAYNPRSQGAIEAFNKTIIEKLRYLKLE